MSLLVSVSKLLCTTSNRLQGSKFKKKKLFIQKRKMKTAIAPAESLEQDQEQSKISYFENKSFHWLFKVAPGFPIDGANVTVIHEPSAFYSILLQKAKESKHRITLASLYLGTGKLELGLVETIRKTVEGNPHIQINILLDYMRGSRGNNNSREMLKPLIDEKYKDCNIFFYHTPKLRGLLKLAIPDRFNELIGLQHMKLYIFDDTLIISGANLSNDYFTNRQDRYIMIENCKDICDFYSDLVKRVGEFSFHLESNGDLVYSKCMAHHPFKSPKCAFVAEASQRIRSLFESEINKRVDIEQEHKEADTWIFPLVQMNQLDIRHDSDITLKIIQSASVGAVLRIATGYFNLTSEYKDAVLQSCKSQCHFIMAHPRANGFFGAKGIAGGVPAAYTKIEKLFFDACEKTSQGHRIRLWEFIRPNWTYHAKGLWYSVSSYHKPYLTLIGSPNFGHRSVERDLETQIAIITDNEALQMSLKKEYENLFNRATPVTKETFSRKERVPPIWVRLAVFFFRYYF